MIPDRGACVGDAGPQLSASALSISELSSSPARDASPPGPGRCPILPPTCLSFLLKFTGTGTTVAPLSLHFPLPFTCFAHDE
jgi:hypothetical protein